MKDRETRSGEADGSTRGRGNPSIDGLPDKRLPSPKELAKEVWVGTDPARDLAIQPIKPVLTRAEVCEVLSVSLRTLDRLPIKSISIGRRTRLYLAKHVLEYLERLAQ